MTDNLKEDFNKKITEIVNKSNTSKIEFDLDPSAIGSLMLMKLNQLNASQATLDEFAHIIHKNPNDFVQAMDSAMLTMIVEDALKCMLEIESENKKWNAHTK